MAVVAQAQADDGEAIAALFRSHRPWLVQRLALVVGDAEEAQDLAQRTYVRLVEHWPLSAGQEPAKWLAVVGLRLAIDERRRRHRWGFLPLRETDASWALAVDPDLWHALAGLDRRMRAALVLTVVEGYTQGEVARSLAADPGGAPLMTDSIDAPLRARLLALATVVPLDAPVAPKSGALPLRPGSIRLTRPASRVSGVLAAAAVAAVVLLGVYLAAGGRAPATTAQPTPSIACAFANSADCQAALAPTLAALQNVGHTVTTVTFTTGQLCEAPSLIFSGAACPASLPTATTRIIGNAVVAFAATTDEAFLNVFGGPQGILVALITVATPPAGWQAPSVGPAPTPSGPLATQPSATAQPWPGRVVATFVSEADTLAYDQARRVIWIPVAQATGPGYLYRYDPASGQTTQWALPATTYRGVLAQVLVDGSGAVWINDDGYRLVRFDPATGKTASYVFPLKVPATDWANGGTWVSAIAADGDGVLVARNQVPYLVRLGPALTVTATINLPSGFAGATGLAVAGGHLFLTAGGPGANVARLSLNGQLEAQFSVPADRLTPHDDGVIASHALTHGTIDEILSANGSVLGTIAPPFTLPSIHVLIVNPMGSMVPAIETVAPSAIVGDGQGRSWYLVQTEPVLREYAAGP